MSTRRLTAAGAIVEFLKRQYVERDEIRRFLERARAGEFAKDAVTPKRNDKEVTK